MESVTLVILFLLGLTSILTSSSGLSFKDQCLYWHNHYRKLHQVGSLKWSNYLQQKAQKYANQLAAAYTFGNDGSSSVFITPNNPPELCTTAVQYIYEEEKRYDYNNPGYSFATGHFTVMVWKKTAEMGAAFAVNTSKRWVIIKYKPMGNMAGQYRDNVFPPLLPWCNATLDNITTRAPYRWSTIMPSSTVEPSSVIMSSPVTVWIDVKASSTSLVASLSLIIVTVLVGEYLYKLS